MKKTLLLLLLLTSPAFAQGVVLDATNNRIPYTYNGVTNSDVLGYAPIGKTIAGEIAAKVMFVGSAAGAGGLTNTELRATPISVTPTVQLGGGIVTATTTRVTLAPDGPGVVNLASIATNTAIAQRAATIVANVASGTIAAGCRSLVLITSADFVGTVLTNFPMPANSTLNFPVQKGDTLPAIAFTRTAGTLFSVEIR